MPKIIGARLKARNLDGVEYEYELELDFRDQAIMQNRLEIDVIAKRRPSGNTEWKEEVAVTVHYDFANQQIVFLLLNREIGRIDLNNIKLALEVGLNEAADYINDAIVGTAGESVARAIETAIQYLPGDPFFGCLIKAGVSTVTGQLVRCIYRTSDVKEHRLRATYRCMADHGMTMLGTAARRALWCMITLGIGG